MMTNKEKRAVLAHIESIKDHMNTLFDQGHTFWHCDTQDRKHGMPFYYYQRNVSKRMSTCPTCYKLMELKRKLRELQAKIGIKQDPLRTEYKEAKHVKRISVSSGGNPDCNPNLDYAVRQ